MEVTTGTIGEGRSQWTYEVTVEFVQVPDDKANVINSPLPGIEQPKGDNHDKPINQFYTVDT